MEKFKHVLIAEDDQEDYDFLIEALSRISDAFSIRKALNGLQVMGYLKSIEKPDIIFLDLNMPIRNGMATLQLLRAMEEFNSIPIVIFSTTSNAKSVDDAFKAGAQFYIIKPISIDVLVGYLMHVFNEIVTGKVPVKKDQFVIGLNPEEVRTR